MAYNVEQALKDGVSEEEIARHLSKTRNYRLDEARKAGVPFREIIDYLAPQKSVVPRVAPQQIIPKPVIEKPPIEEPALSHGPGYPPTAITPPGMVNPNLMMPEVKVQTKPSPMAPTETPKPPEKLGFDLFPKEELVPSHGPVKPILGAPPAEPLPVAEPPTDFGLRPDGTPKGKGFLGVLPRPDGKVSSEISVGVNIDGQEVEIPTLIPTLEPGERDYLLSTPPSPEMWKTTIGQQIMGKAIEHARGRMAEGKSPFAQEGEQPISDAERAEMVKMAEQAKANAPEIGMPTGKPKQRALEPLMRALGVSKEGLTPRERAKASNLIALSKATGGKISPSQIEPVYEEVMEKIGLKGNPTPMELYSKLGIAAGVLLSGGGSLALGAIRTGLGVAGFLGVKEAESLATQVVALEKPKFLQGREAIEFLGPLKEPYAAAGEVAELFVPTAAVGRGVWGVRNWFRKQPAAKQRQVVKLFEDKMKRGQTPADIAKEWKDPDIIEAQWKDVTKQPPAAGAPGVQPSGPRPVGPSVGPPGFAPSPEGPEPIGSTIPAPGGTPPPRPAPEAAAPKAVPPIEAPEPMGTIMPAGVSPVAPLPQPKPVEGPAPTVRIPPVIGQAALAAPPAEAPALPEGADPEFLARVKALEENTNRLIQEGGYEVAKQQPRSKIGEQALLKRGYRPMLWDETTGDLQINVLGTWVKQPGKPTTTISKPPKENIIREIARKDAEEAAKLPEEEFPILKAPEPTPTLPPGLQVTAQAPPAVQDLPERLNDEIKTSAEKIMRPGESLDENIARTKDWISSTLTNDEVSTDQELIGYFQKEAGFSKEIAEYIVSKRGQVRALPFGVKKEMTEPQQTIGYFPAEQLWDKTPQEIQESWQEMYAGYEKLKAEAQPEIERLKKEYKSLKGVRSQTPRKAIKDKIEAIEAAYEVIPARAENDFIEENTKHGEMVAAEAKKAGVPEEDLENFVTDYGLLTSDNQPYYEQNYNKTGREIFNGLLEEYGVSPSPGEAPAGEGAKPVASTEQDWMDILGDYDVGEFSPELGDQIRRQYAELQVESGENVKDFKGFSPGDLNLFEEWAAEYGEPAAPEAIQPPGLQTSAPLPPKKVSKGLPPVKEGTTFYHGTASPVEFDALGGELVYLSPDKPNAQLFAEDPILNRGQFGKQRTLSVKAKAGKVKDIDARVIKALGNDEAVDDVIKAEATKAREEGYRYVAFNHPGVKEDFQAVVSLYPGEDLGITPEAKAGERKGEAEEVPLIDRGPQDAPTIKEELALPRGEFVLKANAAGVGEENYRDMLKRRLNELEAEPLSVPEGWITAVQPTWRKTPGWQAEVDWKDKRIVFETEADSKNVDIVNHEIGHIQLDEKLGDVEKLSDSHLLQTYAKIRKEPKDTHINFIREHLAMDYGTYLTDPEKVGPELKTLFEEYFPKEGIGAIPPTSQHLELMPEEYPNIVSAAVEQDGKIYKDHTHADIVVANNLDPEKAIPGFMTKQGEFIEQYPKPKVKPEKPVKELKALGYDNKQIDRMKGDVVTAIIDAQTPASEVSITQDGDVVKTGKAEAEDWSTFTPNELGYESRDLSGLKEGYFIAQQAQNRFDIIESKGGSTKALVTKVEKGKWKFQPEVPEIGRGFEQFKPTEKTFTTPQEAALEFNRYKDVIDRPEAVRLEEYKEFGKPEVHKHAVINAVNRGESPEGLEDYPDLQKIAAKEWESGFRDRLHYSSPGGKVIAVQFKEGDYAVSMPVGKAGVEAAVDKLREQVRKTYLKFGPIEELAPKEPRKGTNKNRVLMAVKDEQGRLIDRVDIAYDGTEADAVRAADEATKLAEERYGNEWSNIQSQTGATDSEGKAKWIISPNRQHVAEVTTDEASYILGDLTGRPPKARVLPIEPTVPPGVGVAATAPKPSKKKPATREEKGNASLEGEYLPSGKQEYGETFSSNRVFARDLRRFAKELQKELGWEEDPKHKLSSTNIAPVGGDGTILMWKPESEFGLYVSVPVNRAENDSLKIEGLGIPQGEIMWRWTTKKDPFGGQQNQWLKKSVTPKELADLVKSQDAQVTGKKAETVTPAVPEEKKITPLAPLPPGIAPAIPEWVAEAPRKREAPELPAGYPEITRAEDYWNKTPDEIKAEETLVDEYKDLYKKERQELINRYAEEYKNAKTPEKKNFYNDLLERYRKEEVGIKTFHGKPSEPFEQEQEKFLELAVAKAKERGLDPDEIPQFKEAVDEVIGNEGTKKIGDQVDDIIRAFAKDRLTAGAAEGELPLPSLAIQRSLNQLLKSADNILTTGTPGKTPGATIKRAIENSYASLRVHGPKAGIEIPPAGTFFSLDKYRKIASDIQVAIGKKYGSHPTEEMRAKREAARIGPEPGKGPEIDEFPTPEMIQSARDEHEAALGEEVTDEAWDEIQDTYTQEQWAESFPKEYEAYVKRHPEEGEVESYADEMKRRAGEQYVGWKGKPPKEYPDLTVTGQRKPVPDRPGATYTVHKIEPLPSLGDDRTFKVTMIRAKPGFLSAYGKGNTAEEAYADALKNYDELEGTAKPITPPGIAPVSTMLEKTPPGGWTEADKVPSEYRKPTAADKAGYQAAYDAGLSGKQFPTNVVENKPAKEAYEAGLSGKRYPFWKPEEEGAILPPGTAKPEEKPANVALGKPPTTGNRWFINDQTGKMELYFSKPDFDKLPADLKKDIKGRFLWAPSKKAWVSKAHKDLYWPRQIVGKLEKQGIFPKAEATPEQRATRALTEDRGAVLPEQPKPGEAEAGKAYFDLGVKHAQTGQKYSPPIVGEEQYRKGFTRGAPRVDQEENTPIRAATGGEEKLRPEGKYKIAIQGEGRVSVEGEPIQLKGLDKYEFFVHKDYSDPNKWDVSEATSGFRVAMEDTREAAIAKAGSIPKEKFDIALDQKYRGISIFKPAAELTDEEFNKIVASSATAMTARNADLGGFQSDPRFYVSLKPGEVGYQPKLPPENQPVKTDFGLVREYLRAGKLSPEGKEIDDLGRRLRQIVPDLTSISASVKDAAAVLRAARTGTYNSMLHPDNKGSRALFEELTGQKLRKGVKATQEMFTGVPFKTHPIEMAPVEEYKPIIPEGADKRLSGMGGTIPPPMVQKPTTPPGMVKPQEVAEPPIEVDYYESPDLQYERFVNGLSDADKTKAGGLITPHPRNPLAQMKAIQDALGPKITPPGIAPAAIPAGKSPWAKTVYGQNYNKLAKLFTKWNLGRPEDFRGYQKLKVPGGKGAIMDLNVEYLRDDEEGNPILALSHNYKQEGDLVPDPDMEVRIRKDGAIEAMTFQDYRSYTEVYPEPGKVDQRAKKDLNSFLGTWLKNIGEQGHAVVPEEVPIEKAQIPQKGFAAEMLVGNEWGKNALVFATEEEAANYGNELMSRWMGAKETRVASVDQAPNYTFKDWELKKIEEGPKPEEPPISTAEIPAEIQEAIEKVAKDNWPGNLIKERQVKYAIADFPISPSEVERIFDLAKYNELSKRPFQSLTDENKAFVNAMSAGLAKPGEMGVKPEAPGFRAQTSRVAFGNKLRDVGVADAIVDGQEVTFKVMSDDQGFYLRTESEGDRFDFPEHFDDRAEVIKQGLEIAWEQPSQPVKESNIDWDRVMQIKDKADGPGRKSLTNALLYAENGALEKALVELKKAENELFNQQPALAEALTDTIEKGTQPQKGEKLPNGYTVGEPVTYEYKGEAYEGFVYPSKSADHVRIADAEGNPIANIGTDKVARTEKTLTAPKTERILGKEGEANASKISKSRADIAETQDDRIRARGEGAENVPAPEGKWTDEDLRGGDRPESSGQLRGSGNKGASSFAPSKNLPGEPTEPKRGHEKGVGRGHGDVAGVQRRRRGLDHWIEPADLVRVGSWHNQARINLDIIELTKKLEAENRQATPEEQKLLAKYTGWGASELANKMFPAYSTRGEVLPTWGDREWTPLVERLVSLLTPEEIKTAANSTQFAHYTSAPVIRSIYRALEKFGFAGGKILEPGMGVGHFFGLLPDTMRSPSIYTGIEYDKSTASIAKYLYPNQNVLHADYTKQKLPNDFFDLAIGNPPFSSTKILVDPDYKKYRFNLHEYFFAKSLDKVRPGGLLTFITSRYTMDKGDDKARAYLMDRADLIGAIRLPQTAFKENAGTEVVTDVLFFRKKIPGEETTGKRWSDLKEIQTPEGPFLINEYFVDNPEMILGTNSGQGSMYRDKEYTVLPLEGDIEEHFANAVEGLPENIYSTAKQPPQTQKQEVIERDFNPSNKKEGGIYLSDKDEIMIVESGSGVPLQTARDIGEQGKAWLKGYVGIRDAVKKSHYDQLNDGPWETSLEDLQKKYKEFVKTYGRINQYTTYEGKETDEDGNEIKLERRRYKYGHLFKNDIEFPLVTSLEIETETGDIIDGPALAGRTLKKPTPREIRTAPDALAVSLDSIGRFDIEHIAGLLDKPPTVVIEQLGDLVYKDPSKDNYILSDEYLSGDVVAKLEEARVAAETDPQYQRNVEALIKAQPLPLTPMQVTVNLGAPWVPPEIITGFAHEILGLPEKTEVHYDPADNSWEIGTSAERESGYYRRRRGTKKALKKQQLRGATSEWGTPQRGPNEILESVLNNKTIKITYTDPDNKTHVDVTATAAANDVAKKMRARFKNWVWEDTARTKELLDLWNATKNNIAPRKFDGSHLTTPGVTLSWKWHDHQKRAIWRIIQAGNTYVNHAVGAGKTATYIAAGMEMKRMGLINKPIYSVPRSVLQQFANEFQELYPMANIMVADEENFHTDNRRRFIAQATLNNPDAIVVTHSALGLLRMREENIAPVRDAVLDELRDALADLEDSDAGRIRIKQMEKRIDKAQQRFDSMIQKGDNVVTFEDIGADFIFVDEAHLFRKLDFTTNRQAKGIDPVGSQRAMDLYIKTKWLENEKPGRSHVFGSGTPVTNTIGELYTVMRYFMEPEMEKEGIRHFDAWANIFGEVRTDPEMNAAGRYEMVERFSKFVNVPEMMARVRTFMDVVTMSQLAGLVPRPSVKGGQAEIVITPSSDALREYQRTELQPRIETSRAWKPSKEEPGNPDPLINIITDGRLASIDMRFVRNVVNDPNSKLNKWIDGIIEGYKETAGNTYLDENGQPSNVKGAATIAFYNLGFGASVAQRRHFDARAWVMKRFKEADIPAREVAWFDDYNQPGKKDAKNAMIKEIRNGTKRILIGSAKTMGVGLNAQRRLSLDHYLDPPWYPADVEQPDGRILRQGNQNKEVMMKRYATKGSYDGTQWQMVARKSKAIEDAFLGENVRELEDISESSQYEMASALASGDERAIRVAGLKGDIENLRNLQSAHYSSQRELEYNKSSNESAIKYQRRRIKELQEAEEKVPEYVMDITGKVGNKTYTDKKEFGGAIIQAYKDQIAKSGEANKTEKIGEINGFPLFFRVWGDAKVEKFNHHESLNLRVTSEVYYDIEEGRTWVGNPDLSPGGLVTKLINKLNGLSSETSKHEAELREYEDNQKKVLARLGTPFAMGQELNQKVAELAQLEGELLSESAAATAAEAAQRKAEGKQTHADAVREAREALQKERDRKTRESLQKEQEREAQEEEAAGEGEGEEEGPETGKAPPLTAAIPFVLPFLMGRGKEEKKKAYPLQPGASYLPPGMGR